MEESRLIIPILTLLVLAFGLGFVAVRLGLPALLGYLLAGVMLGSSTPGLDVPFEDVQVLADLGVVLLMFSVGVHFSYQELIALRSIVVKAGFTQVALTLGITAVLYQIFGRSLETSFLLGTLVAISSTTVAVRTLETTGTLDRPSARASIGVLLAQDLAIVPILILLPILAGAEGLSGQLILRSLLSVGLVLILLPLLGLRVVPWALHLVARTGSRELFLVAIILVAFGVAVATQQAGLSLALGAFLAGVVISESEFSQHILGEITPLADLFSIVFFASIGLLIDFDGVFDHWPQLLLLLALILVVKGVIATITVRASGFSLLTSVSAGLLLAQIGEFSFALAGLGVDLEIFDSQDYNVVLAAAIASLLVNPVLTSLAVPVAQLASALPFRVPFGAGQPVAEVVPVGEPLRGHAVVAGYGRVGRELVRALQRRGFRFVVVDLNPDRIRELRRDGVNAVYGDIGNLEVLRAARIQQARLLAITVPDPVVAQEGILLARRLKPDLDIIARAQTNEQGIRLDQAGASEVVQPAFEVGLEFVRHTLHRFGVSIPEIQAIVSARRRDYFEEDEE